MGMKPPSDAFDRAAASSLSDLIVAPLFLLEFIRFDTPYLPSKINVLQIFAASVRQAASGHHRRLPGVNSSKLEKERWPLEAFNFATRVLLMRS